MKMGPLFLYLEDETLDQISDMYSDYEVDSAWQVACRIF